MGITTNISPTNIISVTLLGTPSQLAVPNLNTIGLLSQEQPVWFGAQDYAIYTNPTQVGKDFGSSSKALGIANSLFGQTPNPVNTQGYLVVIPRLANQTVAAELTIQDIHYQAVTPGVGGNSITLAYTTGAVAGSEVVSVNGNAISVQIASGISTAQQIATAIANSAPATALVTATVYGVATNPQTAPVNTTNLANGSASGLELPHATMIRVANEIYFFGTLIDFIPTAAYASLFSYVQGQNQMLVVASNSGADIAANGILGSLAGKSMNQIRGIYYNDGSAQDAVNFAAGYAGRGLSVDFTGSLTTFTMNMKQIQGFGPDQTVTQTLLNTALANGVDIYPPFGFQGLTPQGNLFTSGVNGFFDQIYNQFWLKFALQASGFSYLAQTNTKIPQTNSGMEGLKNAYRNVCDQGVKNGMIAPGAWNSPTVFGNPTTLIRNISDIGYYVYSQPVAQQAQSARALRQAPLIQIAAKMAGAIHSSNVIVQVNL